MLLSSLLCHLMGLQIRFEGRKADLAMFKERAGALQGAVAILEEGIAASRAQVSSHTHTQTQTPASLLLDCVAVHTKSILPPQATVSCSAKHCTDFRPKRMTSSARLELRQLASIWLTAWWRPLELVFMGEDQFKRINNGSYVVQGLSSVAQHGHIFPFLSVVLSSLPFLQHGHSSCILR